MPELDKFARTPLETFERIYSERQDPWGHEVRRSERSRFAHTIAALGNRRFARALEVGASIGVFTDKLADRCDSVITLEPSLVAVTRSRERLRARSHVDIRRGAIPEDLPDGPFDLVVCSGVLFYLAEPLLIESLREIERRLEADGILIAVHFRGTRYLTQVVSILRRRTFPSPDAPLSGETVHSLLREHSCLTRTHSETHRHYLLDRYDNSSADRLHVPQLAPDH